MIPQLLQPVYLEEQSTQVDEDDTRYLVYPQSEQDSLVEFERSMPLLPVKHLSQLLMSSLQS